MSIFAKRTKRIVAGTLAGALALSVSPILGLTGTAGAQTAVDPLGAGNFCEDVPQSEPFTDVQPTDPAYGNIVCLLATGVTEGVTATTYEPNSSVTRRQMALFLTRLATEADRLEVGDSINELPAPAPPVFTDLAAESQEVKDAVSQLDQADVANGTTATTYSPGAPVSRRQMAAFIDRLYEFLTGAPLPAATEDHFADDNADSAEAQASTNRVAEAGIFIGNPDGSFDPARSISRRQMAVVITRTFQVLLEAGEITQWNDPDASNQDFTFAAPGDTDTQPTDPATRQFSVTTGSATQLDIALIDCANVTQTGNLVSFNDDAENAGAGNNQADDLGSTDADITVVNGVDVGDSAYQDDVAPSNGTVTFTVESDGEECVIAVVFEDANGNDQLDLDANNQPTERFAISGMTDILPTEANAGAVGADELISRVEKAQDWFIADGELYNYDSNDQFQIFTGGVCTNTTLAGFETELSVGDLLDSTSIYTVDPASTSVFCIEDLTPDSPSLDVNEAELAPTEIPVTVDNVEPGGQVRLYISGDDIADNDAAGFPAGFTQVATITAADDEDPVTAGIQYTIVITGATGSPGGVQCDAGERDITVAAITVLDSETSGPTFDIDNCVPDIGETVAPTLTDTRVTTDTIVLGLLETGDVFSLTFSEDMADTLGDATTFVRFTDANSVYQVACGDNATCVLDDGPSATVADDLLTVTMSADPTLISGTADGLDFAGGTVTITLVSANFDDEAGNQLDLVASADRVLDVE